MAEEKKVMAENGQPTYEGLSQYCPPRNFELAGRELTVCMDSGYDYVLKFERDTVSWGKAGDDSPIWWRSRPISARCCGRTGP